MKLYELARKHNGIVVWEFSQNKKEVNRWLGIGVCSALSASWVKFHAHNDSLANHLGSCGAGKLNRFTLMSMTHLQDSFSNKKKGNVPTVKVWLTMHGLIPVMETYGQSVSVYGDSGYRIITTLMKYYNCYAYFASGVPKKRACRSSLAGWFRLHNG
ncbi:YopT-type cysteine protease domain-containing protein [Endozoicomonas lisbonensis]|uniref:Peptidase C58 YopT-type domain-containing protein n=1 Tax=Endozoicomonas lisbonensis TaxID=3120522 RepID=A0ABV2SAQ6_9GAMM